MRASLRVFSFHIWHDDIAISTILFMQNGFYVLGLVLLVKVLIHMGCVIWVENTLRDARVNLRTALSRAGQRITILRKTICQVEFYMMKTLLPTGTLYSRIRKVSDDSIIDESPDTVDVASLGGAYVWYVFRHRAFVNEEVRVLVEIVGGVSDASNYVRVGYWAANVITGVVTTYAAGYTDYATYDTTIRIYQSPPWFRLKGRGGQARGKTLFRQNLADRVGG